VSLPPIGTVVAKNYLPFARVLARSVLRYHPEARVVVALADEFDGQLDPLAEPFSIVTPADLGVPDLRDLAFRTSQRAFAIALKPYLIEYLARESGSALFLDADTVVLGELGSLCDDVQRHALTLVPHRLVTPRTRDAIDRDLVLNLAGVFNAGVVGIRLEPSSRNFIRWWQRRVHRRCVYAVGRGLHYDQRWLDLALGFVEDLHVHRDPGVNVAHWNLAERIIQIRAGAVTAGGEPCRLFHFSGFDPDDPEKPSKYRPDLRLDQLGDAHQLFRDYAAELNREGWATSRTLPYAYGSFDNGVPIPDAARELYAETPDCARFGDPFATGGKQSYFDWLKQTPSLRRGSSRLWLAVHKARPDLQHAFPEPTGRDRRAFRRWTRTRGALEDAVPPELA
jgi:hypothetical protein